MNQSPLIDKATSSNKTPDGSDRQPTVEKVFEEFAPRVYHLARRLLGNAADAEEITQDVFVQVLKKIDTFRGEAALWSWLYRVTVNTALAYRRKRALRETQPLPEPPSDFREDGNHHDAVRRWVKMPDQQALDKECHQIIEVAIAGLPESYRDVYVLADVEELPSADIGEMLGLSVGAVKSRLHRARLLMRKALAPYFEEQAA